ncbi:MAG: hypothetical protein Kow0031_09300 [Anaerolineae bacterium]
MKQHYQVLELPPNASPRRIKEQYRKLAKQYHPDRTTNTVEKAQFAEKFREINEAYRALSSEVRRAGLSPIERKLDFLYQRGQLLSEQKKWALAMTVFSEIIAIDLEYKDTRHYLQQARQKHRRLVSLYTRADAHFGRQNWGEAMVAFDELLKEAPNYRDAAQKYKRARRERLRQDFMSQY